MKTCVSSYSFGNYIEEDKLGYLGIIDKAAELGFDAIEYTEGAWSSDFAVAEKIRQRAADAGIAIAAYTVGADFINGCGGDIKAEVARLKVQVDAAKALGAPMMRHDVAWGFGGRKYAIGYDNALEIVVDAIRELTEYAASVGVKTMTENHGYFSQDANRVEKLINSVAHPNFGALVDIGNFMCADEDPNIAVGIMAPYAFHVHAKDFLFKRGDTIHPGEGWFTTRAGNFIRGAIIGQGEARVIQSLGILKRAGYDGYVSVEFEGMEDKLTGIRVGHDNLRRFLGLI